MNRGMMRVYALSLILSGVTLMSADVAADEPKKPKAAGAVLLTVEAVKGGAVTETWRDVPATFKAGKGKTWWLTQGSRTPGWKGVPGDRLTDPEGTVWVVVKWTSLQATGQRQVEVTRRPAP
jgi:hypothetical protein